MTDETCMTVHVIVNPWPPGGVGASVWNMGLTSTSQKLWEEGGKGRGGKGWGHSFWHQGLNHVGPKSGPENLKLSLHSWVVNQTWPQLTCKVTVRVPEVVRVNKVYRTCPVVAIEKSIPNGLWRTKGFKSRLVSPHTARVVGCIWFSNWVL